MKIKNFTKASMCGTSFKGTIKTTKEDLIKALGEPTPYYGGDGKVDIDWAILATTEEGEKVLFTVYNWKTEGVPQGLYDWHIGGTESASVLAAYELIENGVKA